MHKAIRIVATSFGAFAGFGGIEHGIFEIMQGNVALGRGDQLDWTALRPRTSLERLRAGHDPAANFLATGILAVALGVVVMDWSLFLIHRRRSGLVLFLLSLALLLFGGGIFPPVIGMIGAAVLLVSMRRSSGGASVYQPARVGF